MTWAKFDDQFPDHPKVDPLSDLAFRLHVAAICHSARYLTDGFVSEHRVPRLVPRYKPSAVAELERARLWNREEGGWRIHDYTAYNPSAEEVEERREQERRKKARQRHNSDRNANGQYVSRGVSPRDSTGDIRGDDPQDSTGDDLGESRGESHRTRPVPSLNTLLPSRDNANRGDANAEDEDDALLRKAKAMAQEALDAKRGRGEAVDNPKAWLAKVTRQRLDELRAAQPNPEAKRRSAEALGQNWAGVVDDLDELRELVGAQFGEQELRDVAMRAWHEARSA